MTLQVSIADIEALLLELPHPNALGEAARERYWRLGSVVAQAKHIRRTTQPTLWRIKGLGHDNKILTIKAVRHITDWGLKEAKDFVEKQPFYNGGVTEWLPIGSFLTVELIKQRVEEAQKGTARASFHAEFDVTPAEEVPVDATVDMGTW